MAHNDETSQTQTREERRKEKENAAASAQDNSSGEKKKSRRDRRIRLVPIWARLLIILALLVLSLIGGLLTGYGMVGDGNSFQILKWETWDRFLEFINGE
ncbi:DNA-directed RNA polymerase subunit beta [Salibacterium salarium]|nr:DNA-directed RNA polymerase subunit beta [Salibacterium salarium]